MLGLKGDMIRTGARRQLDGLGGRIWLDSGHCFSLMVVPFVGLLVRIRVIVMSSEAASMPVHSLEEHTTSRKIDAQGGELAEAGDSGQNL